MIHYFISDVCLHSNIERGIALSPQAFQVMKKLMQFNYEKIYLNQRLLVFDDYVAMMIHCLFDVLYKAFDSSDIFKSLASLKEVYPTLVSYYELWLRQYASMEMPKTYLYDPSKKEDYCRSILDYISGMTDSFILKAFNEVVTF